MTAMARIFEFPERRIDGVIYEPWVDEPTIARHFGGVASRTVRRWRAEGMPSKLRGGRRLYKISECEHWHDTRRTA